MTDSSSRLRKSDRTRAAIAAAAEALFAANGFERTTVRDIAARANIDPAMVMRYFGSKDALFAQVTNFDLRLGEIGMVDSASIGEALVRHYLDLWEGDRSGIGLPILLRSAASNDYAASKIKGVFEKQVMPAIAGAGDPKTAPERAGLVASQLLGMALCRYILKLPPIVKMARPDLVREVGRTIQRYATGE